MNSRTRRQTRQSNEALPSGATRSARVTRSAAHAQQEDENVRAWFRQRLEIALKSNTITQEDHSRIIREAANLKGDVLMTYVHEMMGEEPLALGRPANTPSMLQQMHQQRSAQMIQPGSLANVAHQGSYTVQRMMNTQYGLQGMPRPGMPQPSHHQLGFTPHRPFAGMQPPRLHQNAMGFPMHQRGPRMPTRATDVQPPSTGEVAKTLMPGRTEGQQSGYVSLHPTNPSLYSIDLTAHQSLEKMEMPSNKRTSVQQTEPVAKVPRTGKARRAMEDPSAPDANEMDVVTEAAIDVEEEQEALLNDVPSQGVTDIDGQTIDSDIVNVSVVRGRLTQILRDHGMQLNGIEVSDMMVQGMEERFEGLLKSIVKRSMHRTLTGSIDRDSEIHVVSSDNPRSKLREIKKKQEQHRAAKLREEREKLEQLAETASKKELANNKELAAKVERVKREKQFNAEAEAANRALSNALGDFGFDRIRRRKQDKQAKVSSAPVASQLPPSFPKTESVQAPAVQRPIVVKTKDVMSAMTEDPVYAFSPILYRLCL